MTTEEHLRRLAAAVDMAAETAAEVRGDFSLPEGVREECERLRARLDAVLASVMKELEFQKAVSENETHSK